MVEHVCSLFCFGSEKCSWSQAILGRIEGWETKTMKRLCRFRSKEDETTAGYGARMARTARTIWIKMKLSFLTNAERMWRVMGWTCNSKPNAASTTLRHAFPWRSSTWWQNTKAINMKDDPSNHTTWKRKLWVFGITFLACGLEKKNGASKEKKGQTAEDERCRHCRSVELHRPKIGERSKPNKEMQEPRQLGPPGASEGDWSRHAMLSSNAKKV